MSKTDDTPCIYVADLAAYNAGHLHGVWIECCPADADAWQQAIDEMLAASPVGDDAEEWAIHDYENWHGINPENYDFIDLAEIVEAMEVHGSRAIAGYIGMMGEFDLEDFQDSYQGLFETETDFVEKTLEERGILAQLEQISLSDYQTADQYLDFEKVANDWSINDYYSRNTSDYKILIYTRS